ncbi:MAG: ABC transporter ATP-binding protein, partial [Oscillospiraceae bacterium]|nr:ABC transporter ATP-binding protein [Oscillospiraceae bacterium]
MASLVLKNIMKIYPNTEKKKKPKKGQPEEKKVNLQITERGVVAVQQFNMEVADREFIVLVGPSGCGKSTTLYMISGLQKPTGGQIFFGDDD